MCIAPGETRRQQAAKGLDREAVEPPARRKAVAFTLVELLITLTMIALLAGLLLPALGRAREQARQTVCGNNQRQLALAAQLYWDDHQGCAFYYRAAATNGGDIYWFGWLQRGAEGDRSFDRSPGALYPYLGGRGVELCPSLDYTLAQFKLKATGAAYGYGYNLLLSRPIGQPAFRVAQLRDPSSTALFADAAQVNTFQPPASPAHPMIEEFYYITTNEPTTHFRHSRKADVVFCDSHVEAKGNAPGTLDPRLPSQRIGILDSRCLEIE